MFMKSKSGILVRLYCAVVLGVLAWTIFSSAQNNNTNVAGVTVQPGQPVKSVTTLIELNPTSLSFGLHRVQALQVQVIGVPLWQYVAAAIYVLLAILAAKLLDNVIIAYFKKWTQKTVTRLDDLLIELLRGPIKLLIFVVFLHIGLQLFDFPGWLKTLVAKSFTILLAISLIYMTLKCVDLLLTYFKTRAAARNERNFNELLFPVLSKTLKVIIVILGVLLALDNLGMNIRTLLAGISVSGLAV